jgi:4'-phosphopantetheinyl transferase EntD
VGLDLEEDVDRAAEIAPKILDDDELAAIAGLDARARTRAILVRFSAKEAIYKGLDPFVQRYVGFKEISVSLAGDGRGTASTRLLPGEGPFAIDVRWSCFEGLILTTARVDPGHR